MYHELRPKVSGDLCTARSANYEGSIAKSLVTQAQNEYNLAVSLANQDKWADALSHLQTSSNYLVQAYAEEEDYWRQKNQQQQLMLVGVIAAVAIGGTVIALMRRKPKTIT